MKAWCEKRVKLRGYTRKAQTSSIHEHFFWSYLCYTKIAPTVDTDIYQKCKKKIYIFWVQSPILAITVGILAQMHLPHLLFCHRFGRGKSALARKRPLYLQEAVPSSSFSFVYLSALQNITIYIPITQYFEINNLLVMYLRAGGFEQKPARLVKVHVRKKLLKKKVNKLNF